jgi:hypothetical protein
MISNFPSRVARILLFYRVEFSEKPLNQLGANDKFDLITFCDCLHAFTGLVSMFRENAVWL